jgi:para-nitrobenzyl esterase
MRASREHTPQGLPRNAATAENPDAVNSSPRRLSVKRLAAVLVLLLATASRAGAARAEDTVTLDTGEISGSVSRQDGAAEVRVYKGIPFAAPPVGPLRWKPPEPAAPWKGVRACTAFGQACPQPSIPLFTVDEAESEDCLYLNVWTGAKARDAKLPVMVWIHGGSYAFGSGAQDIYDGAALARRGVVLVTINYRLGPFGFFSHPALSKESGRNASGNYGLLDQIAALEWVKRNAAAFGGDPGCVTIFGESAGGGSVTALLLSPLAKGLFQRAIAESGVLFARGLRDRTPGSEPAERTGERLADALACSGRADVLGALRAKTAKEVLAATAGTMNALGTEGMTFGPVVDGWVIPDDPLALMAAGKESDVPLLIGTTADESSLFIVGSPHARSRAAFRTFVESWFGKETDRVLEQYPGTSPQELHEALARLMTDASFIEPARTFARSRGSLRSRTFMYHFTRVSPGAKLLNLGAHHAAELRYVFETLDAPGLGSFAKRDRDLSKTMAAAWVRFAQRGDPNGEDLPPWPAYTRENDAHLELGDELRVGSGLRREACDLLDSVWASLRAAPKKRWW